jgi:hypothetical protein
LRTASSKYFSGVAELQADKNRLSPSKTAARERFFRIVSVDKRVTPFIPPRRRRDEGGNFAGAENRLEFL